MGEYEVILPGRKGIRLIDLRAGESELIERGWQVDDAGKIRRRDFHRVDTFFRYGEAIDVIHVASIENASFRLL